MFKTLIFLVVVGMGYAGWKYSTTQTKQIELQKKPIRKKNLGKVLILYYSLDGNTRTVANRIKEMTSATIGEIETVEPYPSVPMLYWTARKQIKNSALPKLKNKFPNIDNYDLIFIGSPVWWYTVSAPVLSFLSTCDFKGKTVVPFATHGGNPGDFFSDFRKNAQKANIIDGMDFRKVSKENQNILNEKISNWLDNLKLNSV